MVRASLGGAAMHAEPVQDAKYGEPVGSKKPSDSQIIGLTVFTAKSGALFRPGVSGALLDSAIGRSHSEALSAVVASANFEAKMTLLTPTRVLASCLAQRGGSPTAGRGE